MRCKHCNSKNLISRGGRKNRFTHRSQFACGDCGKFSSAILRTSVSARILLLDIETAMMEYYSWSREPNYLSPDMQIKDWSILCWSAKWLFEPEIMGASVTPKEAQNRTEASILDGIWKLMDEAAIIITQNGTRFDTKRLNSKFIEYGYAPPSQYLNIDVLKVAREKFDFTYNDLDSLGKKLLGTDSGKIKMNINDWKMCVTGSKEHLEKMLTYCKNDVAPLLEDVYLTMRPWITGHPNLNLFTEHDKDVCPNCESSDLRWTETYTTPMGLFEGFRCNSCNALGRGTTRKHKIKGTEIR